MDCSRKKNQTGGVEVWNFQGLIKNEVEFPGVLVFGLGISKGSDKNL